VNLRSRATHSPPHHGSLGAARFITSINNTGARFQRAVLRGVTPLTELSYSYGPEALGLLASVAYRDRIAAAIRHRPDLDLSAPDLPILAEYLERQPTAHLRGIERAAAAAAPMEDSVELVAVIPAYHEARNLIRTLEAYSRLALAQLTEIVIFENHSASQDRDETPDAVDYCRRKFTGLRITHMYHVFDGKPPIGMVRKYATDAVLLRKARAGIARSLILVSNDADAHGIAPGYAAALLRAFRGHPAADAAAGRSSYPRAAYLAYPVLYAVQRLWDALDLVFNRMQGTVELIGRNTAFRTGIYAAIGGYNDQAVLAEDLEIGWLIRAARQPAPARILHVPNAHLTTSPRRAVMTLHRGGRLASQWDDFHANEAVRRDPPGAAGTAGPGQPDAGELRLGDFRLGDFLFQARGLYDLYCAPRAQALGQERADGLFRRAMALAGVDGGCAGGEITVTDASRLTRQVTALRRSLP
jgi:hypothetical protein